MIRRERSDFIKLLTYDLFSLNFPVSDYMFVPSFAEPYDYHVNIRTNLQCASPELYANLAEFNVLNSRVIIMQGRSGLEIQISIYKDRVNTLPVIVKYLLKLIHVLCYEQPS
jgi:hypothetical protein